MSEAELSRLLEYVNKALSLTNRKPFDGDSNASYRIKIEMAEVGPDGPGSDGGFWCRVQIPRQVDNELGMTISETLRNRSQAACFLRMIVDQLEATPC